MSYEKSATTSTASTVALRDTSGNLTANRLISDVATGTAPLQVASTTKVTSLNADQVDGFHASATSGASIIPVAGSGGQISRVFVATGSGAGKVPTEQVDGTLAMETPSTPTYSGIAGGAGVLVYTPQLGNPVSLAQNATTDIIAGPGLSPLAQVSAWYQGTGSTNQTDSRIDFALAQESYYVQEDASKIDWRASGSVRLQKTINNSAVKVLIQGNGSNASTLITCGNDTSLTLNGDVKISTTTPKYGSGCVDFDGTGDSIYADTSSYLSTDWHDHTWVIEGWTRYDSTSGSRAFVAAKQSGAGGGFGPFLIQSVSGVLKFYSSSAGVSFDLADEVSVSGALSTGTWYHIALVFDNPANELRVYLDGVLKHTVSSVATLATGKQQLTFGQWAGASYLDGQMDDLRVTISSAATTPHYTGASFTPPAAEFSDITFPLTGYHIYTGPELEIGMARFATLDNFTTTTTEPGGTTLRFLLSWDGGSTWKDHTGATVALADIHTAGSTGAQVNTYFSGLVPPGAKFRPAIGLKTTDATLSPEISQITIQGDEANPWIMETSTHKVKMWPNATAAVYRVESLRSGTTSWTAAIEVL